MGDWEEPNPVDGQDVIDYGFIIILYKVYIKAVLPEEDQHQCKKIVVTTCHDEAKKMER